MVASGCSGVSSEKVKTADLDATVLLTGDGDGIKVSVTLLQNFHTSVDLADGDDLVASSGDESITLSGSGGHYYGRLEVAPDPGTEVTVGLERATEDDAPSSTATLPETVEVLSPPARASFSSEDELTFIVDDAPGDLHVTWTGTCVQTGDDIGRQVTISGSTIVLPSDAVERLATDTKPCTVVFDVTRDRRGSLDSAFDKGSIVGRQHAEVQLRLRRGVAGPTPSPTAS